MSRQTDDSKHSWFLFTSPFYWQSHVGESEWPLFTGKLWSVGVQEGKVFLFRKGSTEAPSAAGCSWTFREPLGPSWLAAAAAGAESASRRASSKAQAQDAAFSPLSRKLVDVRQNNLLKLLEAELQGLEMWVSQLPAYQTHQNNNSAVFQLIHLIHLRHRKFTVFFISKYSLSVLPASQPAIHPFFLPSMNRSIYPSIYPPFLHTFPPSIFHPSFIIFIQLSTFLPSFLPSYFPTICLIFFHLSILPSFLSYIQPPYLLFTHSSYLLTFYHPAIHLFILVFKM